MKIYLLLRDNFVGLPLPSDNNAQINALRETTPADPLLARARAGASRRRHTKRCARFANRWTNASDSGRRAEEEEGIARRWQNFVSLLPSSSSRHRHTVAATSKGKGTGGKGGSDAYHRGWEAVEHRPKAGRMRHVTMPDGVGQPTNVKTGGDPQSIRDLSLSVKEGPGWGERAACLPPLSPPLFPPLCRLCLSPFGGVQSSRASRATRTLSSLTFWPRWRTPENHPVIPATTTALLSSRGWRPATRVAAAAVETRDEGQNLRGFEEDAKSEPPSSDVGRPPPLLPPLEQTRARARALAPPSSSRVLRQPRESKTHEYRVSRVERTRACPTRSPSRTGFIGTTVFECRDNADRPPACRNSDAYLIRGRVIMYT